MAAPEAADAAPEAPAAKEAPPGEALAPTDEVVEKSPRERYLRFKELIGKGSYKEVWRAYDSVEGIEVAWNVVNLKNMPAHEKACPGRVHALARSITNSAGLSPQPTRRWKPRCAYSCRLARKLLSRHGEQTR